MGATDAPRNIEDLHEFISLCEIVGITFCEVSGRRRDAAIEGVDPEPPNPDDQQPQYSVQILTQDDAERLDVRCRGTVDTPDANYTVDVIAHYRFIEPLTTDRDLTTQFVEKVAIFSIWPFLREAVRGLSSKLGAGRVTLGMIRAGEVELDSSPNL